MMMMITVCVVRVVVVDVWIVERRVWSGEMVKRVGFEPLSIEI